MQSSQLYRNCAHLFPQPNQKSSFAKLKSISSPVVDYPLLTAAEMFLQAKALSLLVGLALIGLGACHVYEYPNTPRSLHGPAERVPELFTADMRMFVADSSNGDVVVVDLPGNEVVEHISTPEYIMILAVTDDAKHLFAMRGRDTDRDYVSVINTGYDPSTGDLRLPYVSRTFVGHSPGGAHGGHMTPVGGKTSMVNEAKGELLVLEGDLDGFATLEVRTYPLASPDHYHYLEVDGRLYIAYLRAGLVQILDPDTGNELGRVEDCPSVHGVEMNEDSGHLFFGCSNDTLVVGTRGDEISQEVARIPYPEAQRAAAFMKGQNGIFWAYTEGTLPLLYRLNTTSLPYRFETVAVSGSIRQTATADGEFLISLTQAGELEIRSGDTGALLRSISVSDGWDEEFDEHVDKAITPDIATIGGRAFVSIPDEGRIAEVDLLDGKLLRNITTGGEPTRIVLVDTSKTR